MKIMKWSALLVGLATSASAITKNMTVANAWMRAMPPASTVTAIYLDIANLSHQDDELVKITSDGAESIEIHETETNNDQGMMQEHKSLPLAKNQKVSFAPGGYHLMVFGLKKPLVAGQKLPFKLEFKNHAPITVEAEVK